MLYLREACNSNLTKIKTMKTKILSIPLTFLFALISFTNHAQDMKKNDEQNKISNEEKLVVVWTSGDRDVAMKMVFMYTFNAKKNNWWKDVTFLIWGPSAKLLSEDEELQAYLKKMQDVGVVTVACKACADMYGVADKLTTLGVKVRYAGRELTGYIKENRHVITF